MQTRLLLISFLFVHQFLSARLPDLIPYRKGNLWGYADSTKKIIIPCKFDWVTLFGELDSARGKFENKDVWIMKNGDFHLIVPIKIIYNWAIPDGGVINPYNFIWYPGATSYFVIQTKCEGLYTVSDSITGLYGYQNCKGKTVIPCIYRSANQFSDGLALVNLNDSVHGYINEKGKFVLKYDEHYDLQDFHNGSAVISFVGQYGIINKHGDYILPPVCSMITDETNFFLVEHYEGSIMMLDKKGKWIDRRLFQQFEPCENNFWMVHYDGRIGFMDMNGKEIVPMKYQEALPFAGGLAAVSDSTYLWGYVNEKGQLVTPIKYNVANSLDDGLAKVSDSTGFWGMLNEKGEIVFPVKYLEIESYDYMNLLKVTNQSYLMGLFNRKGVALTPMKYNLINSFESGFAIVEDSLGMYGFLNEKMEEAIPLKYSEVFAFRNGAAAVKDNENHWGFIDTTGKVIIPCKYDEPVDGGFTENGLCQLQGGKYIDIHGTEYWE